MAKLGRRFCRLVIYANRHTFPFVCASLLLNFSCDFWNYSSKEGSLEHGKTWLGRRFCCLVIHACPICASKWLRRCFFIFFANVGFQVGKTHLGHGKPCFGRCFCCLVIYLNLHGCPVCASKSFQRVFVSFLMWLEHGNTWFGRRSWCFVIYALCQSSQVSMYSNGSGGTVIPEVTDPCMIHHMCLGLSCWPWSLAQ